MFHPTPDALDHPSSTVPDTQHTAHPRRRRITLLLDGGFLALTGATQLTLELVAHQFGRGPWTDIFRGSPYTIGWAEAHGLAALIGLALVLVGARDERRFWHGWALAVHVLLGTANVFFWSSFVTFGTVPVGVIATIVHLAFVVAQTWCLVSTRTGARR